MVQKLPWNLICSDRSDTSKYRWSPKLLNTSLKSNTKSSMIPYEILPNKLLTEHYRNYMPAVLTNFEWDWLRLLRTDFSRSKEGISNLCTTRLWIKPLSLLVRSFWQILFYFIILAKMTWSFCVSLGRLYARQNSANMASVPRNPKQIVLKKRTGKKNIRKQ